MLIYSILKLRLTISLENAKERDMCLLEFKINYRVTKFYRIFIPKE